MPGITVTGLALAPVKALRLRRVKAITLDESGARGDRRFYIVDERGRMVNAKTHGKLLAVEAEYDAAAGELSLRFPGGELVRGAAEPGEPIATRFYSRADRVPELRGPFSEALSSFVGVPLRIVSAESGVDRGAQGAASLISRASLQQLAGETGADQIDARRFRMLIEIDGVAAHEEDRWVGRQVRVGGALLRFGGHVGRCLITSRDPETGEVDLPTLDALRGYRGELESTEPLPFGIYGEVLEGGRVTVGDPVAPDG